MATENSKPSVSLTKTDEVKQVFSRFDVNGDGKISALELVEVMRLGSDTSSPDSVKETPEMKELQDAFELYDLNKNGLISATELHQILKRLGESCSVDDCVNMIKSVDSHGDGYVNFEEFRKMMSNNPSK
ncbi:hypothetical protein L1987_11022 [Smallanthus sonchifolius]|uniref:Uncharacterized protein n=1 Tax=Smallanthus sonchifolius TaxID=185202 RepID=A0ACB9JC13_9ASTR|nr:hypothetical protein L1987_11022 [Smallanthus sonchifolius]